MGKRSQDPKKPRPIICRFARRCVKEDLIKNRKKLKDIPKYKGSVYINEDLTALRARMLAYAKAVPEVMRASTHNGKIFCNMSNSSLVILENPDDLFKIGVVNIDYNKLGLETLNLSK